MSESFVIENAEIFDSEAGVFAARDLLVEGKLISDIANPGAFRSKQVSTRVDAKGCLVSPGLIDVHVHLREPGHEWKETIASGARAALAGGFTTVCCMPNTNPTNDSAETARFMVDKALSAAAARVFPVGAISLKLESKELAPLGEMVDAGCVAFTDDGKPVSNAGLMRRALEWCKMLGVPAFGHEETLSLSQHGVMNESARSYRLGLGGWPKASEEICIARDIELARLTGAHMHFLHVTTARGVELIRRAKNDGISVSGEACPHHLLLTEKEIEGDGPTPAYNTLAKMSPPLREEEDCAALLAGIADGTLELIATDHAPHDADTKRTEFDKASFGIIGLQSAVPLLLELVRTGKLSLEKMFMALTAAPAKLLGKSELGRLQKGKLADITIIDPHKTWTYSPELILSLSKNSPWLGQTFKGMVRDVFVDGQQKLKDGTLVK